MKKTFSFLAVALLLSANALANCKSYAREAVRAEHIAYGFSSQEEVNEALAWYEKACEEAGGNITPPVFM